jgi:methionyl-tRNA formyltransferase
MTLKILLIGYGELAEGLLSGILNTSHEIVGVLSWNRRTKSSRLIHNLWPDKIERLRKRHNLKAIEVANINSFEFVRIAKNLDPDILLIGSWGQILKKHVIEIPNKYCINCHPSYLPAHRGSNPYTSAIMHGEEYSGVSFHQVDEDIDTGPLILQEKVPISPDETGQDLRIKCSNVARTLVVKLLDQIENNQVILTPQDNSKASYFPRIKAEDGAINWEESAQQIHNRIRSLHPWVFSYATYQNKLILIKKSRVIDTDPIEAEPGTILSITTGGLIVSTIDSNKALLLKDLEIFGLNNFVSNWYLKKSLKTGGQFRNAL